jgi:hypothetical protein
MKDARPKFLTFVDQLPGKVVELYERTPLVLAVMQPVRPTLIRVFQGIQRVLRERDVRRRGRGEAMSSRQDLEFLFGMLRVVDPGLPMIRLGGDGDGGYVLPDDLDGLAACFSPGVSSVADFDLSLAEKGVPSFMADASVSGVPVHHPLFDFEATFVGTEDADGWTRLDSWMGRKAPDTGDMLLQMDIEGSEWSVLRSTDRATLRRFRMIILELHDMQRICLRNGLDEVRQVVGGLLEDFEMVHLHANNHELPVRYLGYEIPPVLEATLLRKDRVRATTPVAALPHPLDVANNRFMPEIVLEPYWYASTQ